MVPQDPVDVSDGFANVVAVGPVHGAQPFARVCIVQRDRSRCVRNGWSWRDETNRSNSNRRAEQSAPVQQRRRWHWQPPNSPRDAIAPQNWMNKARLLEINQ